MPDIEFMEAFVAITQVKARYCRALDTKDWSAFADVLTEDFVLDVSQDAKKPPYEGRVAALAMIKASLEGATTAHQVHSPEITLIGDEAQVIWAMQDRVIWGPGRAPAPGLTSLTGYGHYHERYVRKDGAWKIAHQRLTRLHVDFHAMPGK